ncbi:MAG: MFS transporter [Leptospirillum sp.]|jgi:hypothetical protein|nr:MFS transporter [Nitrospiraceae bacterium]
MMDSKIEKEEQAIVMAFGKTSLYADFAYEMAHMLLPLWILHLGGTAVTVSIMESVAEVARMGGAISTAKWGGTPRKQSLFVRIGYGLTAVSTPLMGVVSAPGAIILLKSVSWFGKGLRGPARDALVSNVIAKEWLSRAFSRIQTLDQTGGIIGPLVATALTGRLSVPTLFYLTAIPGTLCFFWAITASNMARKKTVSPPESSDTEQAPSPSFARGVLSTGGKGWLSTLLGGVLLKVSIFPATLLMFRFNEQSGLAIMMGVGFILSSVVHVASGLFLSFRQINPEKRLDLLPGPLLLATAIILLLGPASGTAFYIAGMAVWGAGELWTSIAVKTRVSSRLKTDKKNRGFSQLEIFSTMGILGFQPAAAWGWEHGYRIKVLEVTLALITAGTMLLLKDRNIGEA